ncbi:AMP-dependent synthetase [Streptomyces cyaneogriseus subsp. noncyanogenus]|uniref:AMP-dependent synthetase n=1 Tax=Streptomyces cyaneogriseus subsp. noncyanogenus TaxID=477245 RepID=A0A0C5FZM9_9ACTN|nr:AMP-dependent synthetase [Streptomyces cyaneogriseus subsp. noncyanogenus]
MLHEFLLAGASLVPDRTAVLEVAEGGGPQAVGYRELERRVDAFADLLAPLGLDVGDRVMLEADTSAHAIALLLACSRLGLAFVPVSPETPVRRVEAIAELAEPALFLTTAPICRIQAPAGMGTGRFGPAGIELWTRPRDRVRHRRAVVETDPAYIIFTSGTTGRPKGVVMTQRGIVSYFRMLIADSDIAPGERVATTAPLQFDLSLFDVGMALGSLACCVPVPRALLRWPRRFLRFLEETGVTQVNGVPSIWRQVLRHEPDRLAALTALRAILFSGEEFPLPELRRLRELRPGIRVLNSFGHTECMSCSLTEVPDPLPPETVRLSIGTPHPGSEGMLVDPAGRPIEEAGVTGELYLRSPAMFAGYWGDPEATAAAQVPDPLNPRSGQPVFRTGDLAYRGPAGELYYCGRTDSQVQIRGNRVELGEVEARIEEHPDVAAATALVLPDATGEEVLFAFVTGRSGEAEIEPRKIRAFCAESLPAYMIPEEVRILAEMPLTPNGKVDRAALRERAHPHD